MLSAWQKFKKGKSSKKDVLLFERNLEDNLFNLYYNLKDKTYKHSSYKHFYITDPKLRHISKAGVSDRIAHQALFNFLEPIFDKAFIFDSYSSRKEKGTHKAVFRLLKFIRKESKNYSQKCFIIKCDIKRFFDNIDHRILFGLIKNKIKNKDTLNLILEIIKSFCHKLEKGIPLGNITSQLFANIYLNELDQFVKHTLKVRYYIRFCDDFVIIDKSSEILKEKAKQINYFLQRNLKLSLHSNKIFIRKPNQGIDFLGYIILPHYLLLRTKTKKRMFRNLEKKIENYKKGLITKEKFNQSTQSYLGYLKHARSYRVIQRFNQILKSGGGGGGSW